MADGIRRHFFYIGDNITMATTNVFEFYSKASASTLGRKTATSIFKTEDGHIGFSKRALLTKREKILKKNLILKKKEEREAWAAYKAQKKANAALWWQGREEEYQLLLSRMAARRAAAKEERAANRRLAAQVARNAEALRVCVAEHAKKEKILNNKFLYLTVERCPEGQCSFYCYKCGSSTQHDECEEALTYFSVSSSRSVPQEQEFYGPYHRPSEEREFSNYFQFCLAAVRDKIAQFRELRLPKSLRNLDFLNLFKIKNNVEEEIPLLPSVYNPTVSASPQMDGEVHGDTLQQDQKGNVVIMEEPNQSVAVPAQPTVNWGSYTSGDTKHNYKDVADRWIELMPLKWTTAHEAGSTLQNYYLPASIVQAVDDKKCINGLNINIPNFLVFNMHRYWKGDIEIKIQINSNRFQIGQIQASWAYSPHFDCSFNHLRDNVYNGSTLDHILISASASNTGTLYIPYRSHLPYLHTRVRDDMSCPLCLGRLSIKVLNPLTVSANGPKSCNIVVSVRFPNSEFTGMIDRTVDNATFAVPQMEYVQLAERVLNAVSSDNNRDNPSDIAPPSIIIPSASHSWSSGTGIAEPLQTLRLDPRGTTPHLGLDTDEMTVDFVRQKYGLVQTLEWNTTHQSQQLLFSFPASPLSDVSIFRNTPGTGIGLDRYNLPPLSVLASLFYYWRGSIDFRFDIIAGPFHTGKLMLAYVPGTTKNSKITYTQARSSPHMTFTLGESCQFSYCVPYIANRPYWPRTYTGNFTHDSIQAPSYLYCFVVDELVPMESVSSKIFINVYMRGGSDFEVAVPVQPSIGLSYHPDYLAPDKDYMHANDDSAPYYFGQYYGFDIDGLQPLVARVHTTSGGVSYFDKQFAWKQSGGYYFEWVSDTLPPKYLINDVWVVIKYACFVPDDGDGELDSNKWMLVPVTQNSANAARGLTSALMGVLRNKSWTTDERKAALRQVAGYFVYPTKTSDNTWCVGNPPWRHKWVDRPPSPPMKRIKRENCDCTPDTLCDKCELNVLSCSPEGEREQVTDLVTTGMNVQSTGGGYTMFGEVFNDLKSLCRRYQLYCTFKVSNFNVQSDNRCVFIVPLMPQGLELDIGTHSDIHQMFNKCRDGIIPIIASGYRFFRGSLRFRIVGPMINNVVITVQHRPDRRLRAKKVIRCSSVETAESVLNHGYSTYIQLSGVNGMLEFEVPFYQPGCYGLLQCPGISSTEEGYHFSLGELILSVSSSKDADISTALSFSMHYALADDMRFTSFQGFPPMVLLDDIEAKPSQVASPQMGLFSALTGYKSIDDMRNEQVTQAVEQVTTAVGVQMDDIKMQVEKALTDIRIKVDNVNFADYVTKSPLCRSIIVNVIHSFVNRSPGTLATSLCAILVETGIASVTTLSSWLTVLQDFLAAYWISIQPPAEVKPGTSATPQGDFEDTKSRGVTGFITLLYTTVCGLMGVKETVMSKDKKKTWGRFLTRDIGDIARSGSSVFLFIRNIFLVFDDMITYLCSFFNPSLRHAQYLKDNYPTLTEWIEEVHFLITPSNVIDMAYDVGLQNRIHDAYTVGGVIIKDMIAADSTTKHGAMLNTFWNKLHQLVEKMEQMGLHPYVRKMPFGIRIAGPPGIGKSSMSDALCVQLLKSMKMTTKKNMTFVLNCGTSKYWDQCDGQPVIDMDDMWNIESGEQFEAQLSALFAIMSPVVLCPPKAALEDKKMRYNPEIFVQKTNKPFATFPGVDRDAVLRRTNVLFKCELAPTKKPGCAHCDNDIPLERASESDLRDFHHLRFSIAASPLHDKDWSPWMSYAELLKVLIPMFRENRMKEAEMFHQRVKQQQEIREVETPTESELPLTDRVKLIRHKERVAAAAMQDDGFADLFDMNPNLRQNVLRNMLNYIYVVGKDCKKKVSSFSFFKPVITDPLLNPLPSTSDPQLMSSNSSVNNTPSVSPSASVVDLARACVSFGSVDKVLSSPQIDDEIVVEENPPVCDDIREEPSQFFAGFCSLMTKVRDCFQRTAFPDNEFYQWVLKMYDSGMFNSKMVNQVYSWLRNEIFSEGDLNTFYGLVKSATSRDNFHLFLNVPYVGRSWKAYVSHVVCRSFGGCNHSKGLQHPMVWDYTKTCFNVLEVEIRDGVFCNRSCLLSSTVCNYIWHLTWLESSPVYSARYKKQEKLNQFPAVFQTHKPDLFVSSTRFIDTVKDYITSFYRSYLHPSVLKIRDFIAEYSGHIAAIIGIVGFITGVAYLGNELDKDCTQRRINDIVNAEKEILDYEHKLRQSSGTWSDPQSAHGYSKTTSNKNINQSVRKAVVQGEIPQVDVATKRILRNLFVITAVFDDKRRQCTCIVLEGRKLVILRHYLEEFQLCPPHTKFYGKFDYQKDCIYPYGVQFNLFDCSVQWYGREADGGVVKSNLGILTLPLCFPECKSLVRFIANPNDHQYISGECRIVSVKGVVFDDVRVVRKQDRPHVVSSENTSVIVMDDVYTYKRNGRGMCGSMLLANNLERPIVGIHVAGVETINGYGIAEILTNDMFLPICDKLTSNYVSNVVPELEPIDLSTIDLETAIFPYGCVANAYSLHQSGETQLIPSEIAGCVPIQTAPNPLKKNDPRIKGYPPLKLGCEHMGKPPLDFKILDIQEAKEDLQNIILSVCKPPRITVGVVDESVAIVGDHRIPGYEPLTWTTSEGFPLKSIRPAKAEGKRWLFNLKKNDKTEQYECEGVHSELRRILDLELVLRKQGIKPFTVFSDCLKDTCLPIEKNNIPGKTRIFSVSPVQFTINFKRYFLDFMVSYQNARFDAEHGIGINCDSSEWSQLAGILQSKGGKIVAGDYKNYGPGLMKKAAEAACQIILDWYASYDATEEDQRVRRIMLYEILEAPHLVQNLIYFTPCGVPSGSPITSILNSLVNSIYLRVAWKHVTGMSYAEMHEHCSIITYGDDVVIAISDYIADIFNTSTISLFLSRYNIVFTDQDKTGDIIDWRTLDNVTFLKRGFLAHPTRPGEWLAPIDRVSIGSCLNWIRKKGDRRLATLENCTAALNLAYGHGPKVYDEYRDIIRKAVSEQYGVPFICKSWIEYDHLCFSKI